MDRVKSDSEKKFSIVIPTRNGAPYVFSAINSILRQSYPSCEVVVSVNHSTDETMSQVRSIDDPRLRVVVPPAPLSMPLPRYGSGAYVVDHLSDRRHAGKKDR